MTASDAAGPAVPGAEAAEAETWRSQIRADLALISQMVAPGSRVLDVGCATGELLECLVRDRSAVGRGIELSQAGVNESVRRGLSVVQGDADTDLVDYPTGAFDYVILSQTLQATRNPAEVLRNLVRIGRHAIVSFPNFGHWRVRARLALTGRMPVSEALPETWYETPNIHLCTIRDFLALADQLGIEVERSLALDNDGRDKGLGAIRRANLFAQHGLFLLRGAGG
jgi:methionine biosynthesis protein MetW